MSVDILDRVYDAYMGQMGQHFMRETQRRIHWMCAAVAGDAVLDVGCSQGLVPILLGREGKSVVGIDTSAVAISAANERLGSEAPGVRRLVSFVEGDFVAHPFGDVRFDCIVMGEVLEHLLQPQRFIETAARLLPNGGRLVVTVPFGINDHVDHKHTFYLQEPARLLAEHFDVTEVTILGKWLGLVGVRREGDAGQPKQGWSEGQVAALERGFLGVERELVDELVVVRGKLDDANAKYRASSEDVTRLKREAAHHETERKAAERAKAGLEQQLADITHSTPGEPAASPEEIERLRNDLRVAREDAHGRELQVVRLEERLAHAEQLRGLELGIRDSEIARLNKDREELGAHARAAESRAADVEERARQAFAFHDAEARRLKKELESRASEAQDQADRITHLESGAQQMATLHAQDLQEARRSLSIKQSEVTRLTERLQELEQQLHDKQAAISALEQECAELGTARVEREQLQGELVDAQQRLLALEAGIEERIRTASANAAIGLQRRVDEAASAQAAKRQAIERDLEEERRARSELSRSLRQAREQLNNATQSERRVSRQLEQERRSRSAAERKVIQTRNTISFQLGYELIHGVKSRQRLMTLPSTLWALNKEAARRRAERAARDATPSVPPVPSSPVRTEGKAPTPATPPPASQRPAEEARHQAPVPRPAPGLAAAPPRRAPDLTAGLTSLRVACIHDEFTFASYRHECQLAPLTPANFHTELEAFQPDLLFVESAWRGKDDLWGKKVSHRGRELLEIVEWCQGRGVPTVFWNKEDPVHFGTFLNTAKLFDYVFTTDLDCIGRYKQALGHDRVFLLPFACQPAQHNPIEKYERKTALSFAGAYYARYPERQQDLASFALNFNEEPRLEIFDRNHGKNDPSYAFPEEYRQFIVGTLPFDEIDRAYKGYKYALNLNSIKESQTMFARRLYELLGSNTITVSNFSRGIRLLFGDLVITTDSGERARERLLHLTVDENRARRFRLAGLRKVMREHTYAERLKAVAARVWGGAVPDLLPPITVLALADSPASLRSVLSCFEQQSYVNKQLILVTTPQAGSPPRTVPATVTQLTLDAARSRRIAHVTAAGSFVATFSGHDHYGSNYLMDLGLATRYSQAKAIGKVAYFESRDGSAPRLRGDGAQYRRAPAVRAHSALVHRDLLASTQLGEWLQTQAHSELVHPDCLAVDEFNYCAGGALLASDLLASCDDLLDLDVGLSISELVATTTSSTPAKPQLRLERALSGERLATMFRAPNGKPLAFSADTGGLLVQSALGDETHEYVYANQLCSPQELGLLGSGRFHLEASPGLNVQLALVFLDENKQRLGHKLCPSSRNETASSPEGTAFIQLGLRIFGSGSCKIARLWLDHVVEMPERIHGRSRYLLVTNHYPAHGDLYRNGFVHRRVLDYRRQGTRVDVFRHRQGEKLGYREFEGVDVISGGDEALAALLRNNDYHSILVHFLDPAMWRTISEEGKSARRLLWLHGAEIQAWHRRRFNDTSESEQNAAKLKSEKRDAFWRSVFSELPDSGKLIFVSQHFAQQTMSDLGLPAHSERCTVIHNLVDGQLFQYRPKSPELRKRVLSIRPFVSRKYANDLTVAAILELAKHSAFQDLFFHLVGDGPLFDATVEPLRAFSNVRLDKGFLTQAEIARLHGEYGVFLCPTRDDTQGVSRDEAMASGLVPVTNRVAAVPEFVDDSCAILAEPDSHLGLAAGMARLFEDENMFVQMSERAAQRVRRQSSAERTTARELLLIKGHER